MTEYPLHPLHLKFTSRIVHGVSLTNSFIQHQLSLGLSYSTFTYNYHTCESATLWGRGLMINSFLLYKHYFKDERYAVYNLEVNSIQLLTGVEENSSFVWPAENGSIARIQRLRATDPFEGQTKLLLFSYQSKTVLLCTFIFKKISYSLFQLT